MQAKAKGLVVVLCVIAIVVGIFPATAQGEADGYTLYQLNMRTGPGVDYDTITVLQSNVGILFEARTENMDWLLGHTEDGAFRGWVASLYVTYRDGFAAARLPVSDEVVTSQPVPVAVEQTSLDISTSVDGTDLAPSGLAPQLEALPIVPNITGNARTIFQRGQVLGNRANIITKVGECNSLSYAFLNPFNSGEYDLGHYGQLQSVIDSFAFVNPSQATGAGFTAMTVVDAAYGRCGGGLSPLECEYQQQRPSVAFIMLGMHDVYFLYATEYEQAMRRIIEISIDQGVIPVLTTFPVWPEGGLSPARFNFNTILVNLAHEYDVPLMNFWRATQSVEHSGVGVDHVHITERGDSWTAFNGEEYQYGMTMWNLVALQTLAQIQQAAMQ